MTQRTKKEPESFLSVLLEDDATRIKFAGAELEVEVQARLVEAMEEQRVSQSELARRLGLTRSRISQVMSGDPQNLTLEMMGRLAAALNLLWKVALHKEVDVESKHSLRLLDVGAWNSNYAWTPVALKDSYSSPRPGVISETAGGAGLGRLNPAEIRFAPAPEELLEKKVAG